MSTQKKGAAQKNHPDNSVKQVQYTKIIVELNFTVREINGKPFEVPNQLRELFILKLAAFELNLETLLSDYPKIKGGNQ